MHGYFINKYFRGSKCTTAGFYKPDVLDKRHRKIINAH